MTSSKILLITGVSSGFGRALAQEALAAGHQVVGTVRTAQAKRDAEGEPQQKKPQPQEKSARVSGCMPWRIRALSHCGLATPNSHAGITSRHTDGRCS